MSLGKLAKEFWDRGEDAIRAGREKMSAEQREDIAIKAQEATSIKMKEYAKTHGTQYINVGGGKLMVVTDSSICIKDLTTADK